MTLLLPGRRDLIVPRRELIAPPTFCPRAAKVRTGTSDFRQRTRLTSVSAALPDAVMTHIQDEFRTASATVIFSSWTPSAGLVYVATVWSITGAGAASVANAMTGNGLTWTRVAVISTAAAIFGTTFMSMAVFISSGGPPSTGTSTITWSANPDTAWYSSVESVQFVTSSTTQTGSAQSDSSSPSITLGSAPTRPVMCFVCGTGNQNAIGLPTVGSGYTALMRHSSNLNGSNLSGLGVEYKTPVGTQTPAWGNVAEIAHGTASKAPLIAAIELTPG